MIRSKYQIWMRASNTVICLIVAIVFTSCQEDEGTVPKVPPVDFSFSHLDTIKEYGFGDTVFLDGSMTWENELHGYQVIIINTTTDSIVMTSHNHEDSKRLNVHTIWVNNLIIKSDMKLTIDALTDHNGAKETKEIEFRCHPK